MPLTGTEYANILGEITDSSAPPVNLDGRLFFDAQALLVAIARVTDVPVWSRIAAGSVQTSLMDQATPEQQLWWLEYLACCADHKVAKTQARVAELERKVS